jgi:NadR type nicotinamide-nucleotide adenylyltransferase
MPKKPYKIVLYGPESTGKTILAQELALHFNSLWIPEFARHYLENKKSFIDANAKSVDEICTEEDIPPIVLGQISSEDSVISQAKDFVFLDTNPLQTAVYVSYYYGKKYSWLEEILATRNYDFYLLMDVDIPWIADPLRDRPNHRRELFQLFESELITRKILYQKISGDYQLRIKKAIEVIHSIG